MAVCSWWLVAKAHQFVNLRAWLLAEKQVRKGKDGKDLVLLLIWQVAVFLLRLPLNKLQTKCKGATSLLLWVRTHNTLQTNRGNSLKGKNKASLHLHRLHRKTYTWSLSQRVRLLLMVPNSHRGK